MPTTRFLGRTSATRLPRGRGRFARVALVMAWIAFWLNAAIFPCCEAIAAVVGGDHAIEEAQSNATTPHAHLSGGAHSEGLGHDPYSPCEHALGAEPALVGEQEVLATDRFPLHWVAVEEHFSHGPTVGSHRPSFALPRAAPPPLGFYQRSQRLLI